MEFFIFYFIFQKFVTKNRAFGNNTIFLQQFFQFGGGDFPLPPWQRLCAQELTKLEKHITFLFRIIKLHPLWLNMSNSSA